MTYQVLPNHVFLRELGPREGLQGLHNPIELSKKLDLIEKLAGTNVSEIEITAMVKPDRVPQMADADKLIELVLSKIKPKFPKTKFHVLYLNRRGFERAAAYETLDLTAWIHTATSNSFLKNNANSSLTKELEEIPSWIELFSAKKLKQIKLMVSTAFGCAYEGPIAVEKLLEVIQPYAQSLESAGSELCEISLADTVGVANPQQVREYIRVVRQSFPKAEVSLHLHDTRGLGLANVYAGLLEGVARFDASLGGIGGCPFTPGSAGNVCSEDIVYLCESLGIKTDINLGAYIEAAQFAKSMINDVATACTLEGHLHRAGLPKGWK